MFITSKTICFAGNPVAGGPDDQPIDWEVFDQRVSAMLGVPFQFKAERFDLWANIAHFDELGEAARVAAADRAVAQQVSFQPLSAP